MVELNVQDLTVTYGTGKRAVQALRGVSFSVQAGETVALVGESGCGKSTTAAAVAGLIEPNTGTISVNGSLMSARTRSTDQRRQIQMVFQHPDQSLDRRWTVQKSVEEPLIHLTNLERSARLQRCQEVISQVGLDDSFLSRSPRSLSGGQAQRVAIARALAPQPNLVVLDEPTASLDQSVRSKLLRLLKQLQRDQGLSYLLITHDMASVRKIADRVVVMYLGLVVESGRAQDVIERPVHPYTRALLRSVPGNDPRQRGALVPLAGETPSPTTTIVGCAFAGRCEFAIDECRQATPPLLSVGEDRQAACIRVGDI